MKALAPASRMSRPKLHDPDGMAGPIPIQPSPSNTKVTRLAKYGFNATVIVRDWRPGDTRRCRLCRECTADHAKAICVLTAIGFDLTPQEAAMYSIRGLPCDRG